MSEHGHGEQSFWRTYVFSVDHKVIGLQYLITSFVFLLLGFSMVLLMRWQLAWPGSPIPLIGKLLPFAAAPGGVGRDPAQGFVRKRLRDGRKRGQCSGCHYALTETFLHRIPPLPVH